MSLSAKLVCDGISIVSYDHDPSQVRKVCERLEKLIGDNRFQRYRLRPGRRHKFVCDIPVTGIHSSEKFRFEVGAKHPTFPDYRFSFNPDKIGSSGFVETISALDLFTEGRAVEITKIGKVTRCDFAVDISGLSLKDAVIRNKGHQKHGVFSNRWGEPESSYLGSPHSNCLLAYDKTEGTDSSILRLEKRMKNLGPLSDLALVNNPFDRIQIVAAELVLAEIGDIDGDLFLDCIRVRGFTHAIKKLGKRRREAVQQILRDPTNFLIPFDQIWATRNQMFAKYGFGQFLGLPPEVLSAAE